MRDDGLPDEDRRELIEAITAEVTERVLANIGGEVIGRLDKIIEGVELGTAAIGTERAVRHREARKIGLTVVGCTVLTIVVAVLVVLWVRVDRNTYTCDQRTASRSDYRAAMEAGTSAAIDVVADYAEVPEDDLPALSAEASRAAAEAVSQELPPPDC